MASNILIGSAIARDLVPITPHDTNTQRYHGIVVKGNAGNVVVETEAGVERTIPFAAGEREPISVVKVKSTGTTATNIWGYKLFAD